MRKFSNNTMRLRQFPVLLAALLALFGSVGCVTTDDTLGANLLPEDQQIKAGYALLQSVSPRKYVETRLYQTDSIVSSNLSKGYFGTSRNDTVGLRTAGFLTQFTNYYLVDEGYFGYMPIFDSAQIILSLSGYGRDTVTEQHFEVYEVIDNAYLTEKPLAAGSDVRDSVFYISFDPMQVDYLKGSSRRIVGSEPLFTFKLGTEQGGKGPSVSAVTMTPTAAGKEFVSRLMLQTGEHAGDYSIYDVDNVAGWSDIFKGLYIKPADTDAEAMAGASETKGTIYATDLGASGLAVYGRNRMKEHPELIKDTIGMVYYFYPADQTDYGTMSVNTVRHDYTGSQIDLAKARAYNEDGTRNERPVVEKTYVEGLGGVVTEIAFTQAFYDALQALIDTENATGKNFRTIAFTQVLMEVYFPGGQYDWERIDSSAADPLIRRMNSAPSRLGMYTNYWRRLYIVDYNYTYENYYSTTLPYGGYINRSHGCYRMDITGHVQQVWNAYLQAKEEAGGGAVDCASLPLSRVYLGPEATDLFTNAFTELQNPDTAEEGASGEYDAPIRFAIAYNLVR